MKRAAYLRRLRELIGRYGSENIVYFDETGFVENVRRESGWAPRGVKVHGDFPGKKQNRTNLIMAQRGKEWLAPILFEGMCEAVTVVWWIKEHLLKALTKPSVIVMDNAPIHPKGKIRKLLEQHGHTLLCLPKYSPDLNPIEQSFAVLKKLWITADRNTKIDNLIMCNY